MKRFVEILDETSVMLLETALKCLNRFFLIANKMLINGNNIMLLKFIEYGGV
jgi:hypothetical protein